LYSQSLKNIGLLWSLLSWIHCHILKECQPTRLLPILDSKSLSASPRCLSNLPFSLPVPYTRHTPICPSLVHETYGEYSVHHHSLSTKEEILTHPKKMEDISCSLSIREISSQSLVGLIHHQYINYFFFCGDIVVPVRPLSHVTSFLGFNLSRCQIFYGDKFFHISSS